MLEVRDLHAYYGKSHILQGVDLDVGEDRHRKFDWLGFIALAAVLGGAQLMMDRGQRVGWLSRERASLLARWPHWFDVSTQRVDLRETVATEAQRTAALAEVIMRLAEEGHVRGWRDERFDDR